MAAQPHTPDTVEGRTIEETVSAVPAAPPADGAPAVELVGHRIDPLAPIDYEAELQKELIVEEAVLPHHLHEIDALVELVHLQELVAEKDARISLLVTGIAHWRDRALREADDRRGEAHAAHERERDLVRVLHHNMIALDECERRADEAERRLASLEREHQGTLAHLARTQEQLAAAKHTPLDDTQRHWWQRFR